MNKLCKLALLAAAAGAMMGAHAAGSDSTTFQVKITITETCTISTTAPTDVDFGSNVRSATVAQATGVLNVNCSNGTPYKIGLGSGNYYDGTNRRMKDAGTNYIAYGLYRTSGTTDVWDNSGTNMYSATGTGSAQAVNVYGTVSGSTNVPAGNYADTITATISY